MGLKPSATSFKPASSARVCVSSASRADGWMASAMAFMVVAIVLVFCACVSVRCRARVGVQLVRIGFFVAARRRRGACDPVRAARAARRAPRALGQRDAIFCKGIFGCAARGRFYAALFGRQRGNGVGMLCTRARWLWCKWRRTRSCAVVCRRSGQVSPETTLRGASSGNSIFNLRLAPLAWSEGPPLPRGSP